MSGDKLLSAATDKSVRVWDVQQGTCVQVTLLGCGFIMTNACLEVLDDHSDEVVSIHVSYANNVVVTGEYGDVPCMLLS